MENQDVSLAQVFQFADLDEGSDKGFDKDDLFNMFKNMGLADRLSRSDSDAIFMSIDFDNSNDISLPEFKADFDDYLNRTEN